MKKQELIKKIIIPLNILILLVISQIIVKFIFEFPGITEVDNFKTQSVFNIIAWIMTAGWIILLPLIVMKKKSAIQL